jgi:aminopeptidase N
LADEGEFLVGHELTVRLIPADHRLEAEDQISLPRRVLSEESLHFLLNSGLEVESLDPGYAVELVGGAGDASVESEEPLRVGGASVRKYRLRPTGGAWPADARPRLGFRGTIRHPLIAEQEQYARSFSRTSGTIGEEGVMLAGASFWLPTFGEELVTFRLTVTIPEGWDVVSQGERTLHEVEGGLRRVRWDSPEPMDELYLVAGRYTEYSRSQGGVSTHAFLRSPDSSLAAKYLDVTTQYLEMYSSLIGPYPYKKFALVENFWETGYGMPSFTLLGPKVIRLPFILHSSYPHEILHNWWGNSVYVRYAQGNWSEGLTAYLADHLVKESQGKGIDYRRDALGTYRSFVREEADFPLSHFRSRHSSASEAIGYGKSLMLWHMLRRQLGDQTFAEGLQRLYREFRFKRASFQDIERVFAEASGQDLEMFFHQWVEHAGAPMLSLETEALGGQRLRIRVHQDQPGILYEFTVPIAVTLADEPDVQIFPLVIKERVTEFELELPAAPLRVDLDPYFDVFRRLDPGETPPTLGDLFGAPKVTLVLPDGNGDALAEGWEDFARTWSSGSTGDVEVAHEKELETLPADRAVWVLGTHNGWRSALLSQLHAYGAGPEEGSLRVGGLQLPQAGHSFAYSVTHPERPDLALGWVGADDAAALPGLARKLPHYARYSYLAFSGEEPTNVAKGQWEAVGSPLVRGLVPSVLPPRARLPARQPLARLGPLFDSERLMSHVRVLAADALEGRGVGTPGLEEAGDYIARAVEKAGLEPGGEDGSFFQIWSEPEGPRGKPAALRNIVGVLRGRRAEWGNQSVVVGAHYDHLGRGWPDVRAGERGQIHNGADDNASGVAVLLELATLLAGKSAPDRTLVFVAFAGEEWDRKGSRHYVRSMEAWPAKETLAMVNLDSVGRLEGKKLLLLGAGTAEEWIHIAMGVGFTTGIEATAVLDDPGGSDQASFQEVGIPAVQVFTGTHGDYHRPGDDADKVDPGGLAKVALFVREMVVYLSQRDRPLTSKGETVGSGSTGSGAADRRRVGLGTVPDYSFAGPGIRAASIVEGSPAASAGLKDGDILLAIDAQDLTDVRVYAEILRKHRPGDRIRIRVRRGQEELELEASLEAR